MIHLPRYQRGFLMLAGVAVMLLAGLAFFVSGAGALIEAKGKQVSETIISQARIQGALINYVATYRQLPCPANPNGGANQGRPNGDPATPPYSSHTTCTYPTGVVPWLVLGLSQDQVMDEWGRMISYRVFDGAFGLTQTNGASRIDCDTNNGTTPESSPTNGLCNVNHNTLVGSFTSDASYVTPPAPVATKKGLLVTDATMPVQNVAFVLISHGPTGLGAYTPVGAQLPVPLSTADDYPNTLGGTTQTYRKLARSDPSIAAGTAGYYDDTVSYLTIDDLLRLSGQDGRDWSEVLLPTLDASTTANMTSSSSNPLAPHFMSSGIAGSGQEFTASDGSGFWTLYFGNAAGAYSGCNWWPAPLVLKVQDKAPDPLVMTTEFATADNTTNDPFPGFTFGFLSALQPAPTNTTCGTSSFDIVATSGAAGDRFIDVPSTGLLEVGMRVYGAGIPLNATISTIVSLTRVRISANKTANVTGKPITFANLQLIRRNMGWEGGTLSAYTNRFAMEFDFNPETASSTNPTMPTANDPSTSPHIAIDRSDVTHLVASANSCSPLNYGAGCQRPPSPFPAPTPSSQPATTISPNFVTVTNPTGILVGMPVTGLRIGTGAIVLGISGSTLTLSVPNTTEGATTVTIGTVPSANFMNNGLSAFNVARLEIQPESCSLITATGTSGTNVLNLTGGASGAIPIGSVAFGSGIRPGVTVKAVSGTTITLSGRNTAAINGPVSFALPTQVTKTTSVIAGLGTVTLTLSDVAGVAMGMSVSGSGIAGGTRVTNVSNAAGSTLTVSLSLPTVAPIPVNTSITFTPQGAIREVIANTSSTITVSDATYLLPGMNVYGTGIPPGTTISSITGSTLPTVPYVAGPVSRTIGLSNNTTGAVTSATFTQAQMFVKSWTLSNAGCNANPSLCASLKSVTDVYSDYAPSNNQVLHAASCFANPLPSNAYDSVYYGITTANASTSGVVGNNLAINKIIVGYVPLK